ncbi:Nuclear pore complex protein Nup98-Nup96 [Chionoecetes opilio]|uniref:Nuclear pore complex protein Nup98-Nup96 n=1 Tax=Chionoecetes opilio TaxID=41210 RepID=A0A8J4YFX8_CHIOP|nr:Nuclear pore complex protein Nup98-Nup96 [Chionoecetes opilio]
MVAVPPKQLPPPDGHMPPHTTTPSFLPLPLPHKTAGPPATALTSPPQYSLGHTTTTPVLTQAVTQGRFLESALQDYQLPEDDLMDSVAREPEESANMSILSPSAERMTVVSRVVPRTVQQVKMQLFGGREEEEEDEEGSMGGRETCCPTPPVPGKVLQRLNTKNNSLPYLAAINKRRMVSGDVSVSRTSSPSQGEARARAGAPPAPRPTSPKTGLSTLREEPSLHEPRTEYQLMPSGREEGQEAGHVPPQHQAVLVPLADSLQGDILHCQADMGAFMGRSFRVGWGPGWSLAHIGPALALSHGVGAGEEEEGDASQSSPPPSFLFVGSLATQPRVARDVEGPRYRVVLEQVHTVQPDYGTISALIEECLGCILEHSILEGAEDMDDVTSDPSPACPFFRPLKDVEFLHQLVGTTELHAHHEPVLEEILTLCVALWGRLDFYRPESDGESEYCVSRARVEAVSLWLERVSQEAVVGEVGCALGPEAGEEGYLEAILAHLSARQVSQACVLAQDRGDHHLALLLAQSCMGQNAPREIMGQQLANWAEGGTDALMSPARLTLYTLLSGAATHQATHTALNACTDIDWRRALALHLWYVCPATATLAEALHCYDEAAGLGNDSPGYCNPPMPPYLATHHYSSNMKVSHDMCYHLLKLFTDPRHPLEALLNPATAIPDPLNVSISWLMWQVLESLNYHHLSGYHSAALHLSMAALLEAAGHWHWAVFALLHLADQDRRQREVRELLLRHVKVGAAEAAAYRRQEAFVVERLRLPRRWIHHAKATRARALGMVDEEAWYLLKAGELNRAHTLIVDTIAPNSIINEDHEYLCGYLDQIRAGDQHKQVAGWRQGGGCTRLPGVQCTLSKATMNPDPEAIRLCVSEMSKKVVGVLRAVVGEGTDATQVLSQQLSSLPLTHDYALAELNLITNHYLTHLAADT